MATMMQDMNSLIYVSPLKEEPSRYELIRYSTWRIYFFQELQSMPEEKVDKDFKNNTASWISKFPHLITSKEQSDYYEDLLNSFKGKTYREDIISHFGCRLLYCHDSANHSKFIEMEKLLFRIRLHRRFTRTQTSKSGFMILLKKMLAYYLECGPEEFNVPAKEFEQFGHKIMFTKKEKIEQYASVPMEYGEAGVRKRFCFVRKGNVYMNIDAMIDLVQNLYANALRSKLEKMRVPVIEMLNNDVENQMSGFIRKTLDTLNSSNFDQTIINNQFKLNLKNIEALWKKFFPPCMQQLNKRLKEANHLKHEGRRQLWLFLKGCGMEVNDNMEYFRKHLASKVSGSDLKSHMYNIQHAYGLVGKKSAERPKNCRNIITGPAPKKDQHHGCPFAHWRKEEVKEFIRKNYDISQQNLQEVMRQKQENHFQVACGRLFEGVTKAEGVTIIPPEITNLLGKSPHEYFQARMEMINFNNNKTQEKKEKKVVQLENKAQLGNKAQLESKAQLGNKAIDF